MKEKKPFRSQKVRLEMRVRSNVMTSSRVKTTCWSSLLLVAFLSSPWLAAQAAPSDSLLSGFAPVGDYLLEVDGQLVPQAQIYLSQKAPAYLVLAPGISPAILLVPRSGGVHAVERGDTVSRADGSVDIQADAELAPEGKFTVEKNRVVFPFQGHRVVMKEKPPLLGVQSVAGLKEYSGEYAHLAEAYSPSREVLRALREQPSAVKVRVYFGSWCPFCKRYVPRMVRVAEELAGSRVAVDYYGLPRALSSDPVSGEMGIKRVPTGIVYKNGREVGRIDETGEWEEPELALQKILGP